MSYVKQWNSIYLKDALARLKSDIAGFDLTIEDVYIMQQVGCAFLAVVVAYANRRRACRHVHTRLAFALSCRALALNARFQTVNLGYSNFCELFTEEEWEGFEYA